MKATVDQFNAVSLRVISTILTCTESKTSGPNMRGKYISQWINVAQVNYMGFLHCHVLYYLVDNLIGVKKKLSKKHCLKSE